jgi:MFS family permease
MHKGDVKEGTPLAQRLGLPKTQGHKALVIALLIDALGTGLYLPFSLLYFQKIAGLALPTIGIALTIATVLTLPIILLTGTLVDRFGGQRLVVVSQLLQAAGFLGYLVVHSFSMLLFMALLVTAGTRIFYTASIALIAEIANPDERDRWYGFVGATQWLGQAIGGLLAGFIVGLGGTSGYRILILGNVFSFLVTAIILHWHKISVRLRPHLETTEPIGYRAVLADHPFLVLVVCNVIFALSTLLLSTGSPVYMLETLGTSTVVIGALPAFSAGLTICAQTLVIRHLEPYRRTRSLAVASLIGALGYVLLALVGFVPHALLVPSLFGITAISTLAGMITTPTATALAATSSPPHLQGRYMAIYQFSWGVASAITPSVFTLLYTLGPRLPWVVLTGLLLIAGFSIVLLEPHLSRDAVRVR